jgi:hypothetical protein
MSTLWSQLQSEVRRQMATQAPRIMLAGAASGGLRKLRNVTEAVAGEELFAAIKGLPKISTDDELLVLIVGGKKVIVGPIQRTTPTAVTYDLPVIGEKGFNSPYSVPMTISNSAAVASTSSTGAYSVNVQNASVALPTGTWTVFAWGEGHYAHSAANGVVRVHMQVGSDAGTAITTACQQDPGRTSIGIANEATNQSGTISIGMEYRPNTTGTAYAGGGWLKAIAWRTS